MELGKTSLILDDYSVRVRVLGNSSLIISVKPLFQTKKSNNQGEIPSFRDWIR
ncbi:hypothetical protein D3C75_509360 [compost metagenome]